MAKSLLQETEIKALNILTSATLELFESQVEQRRPTTLTQFLDKMRDFIKLDGRPLILAGYRGRHSMEIAKEKAAGEVAVYKARLRLEKEAVGERDIEDLLKKARNLASDAGAKRKLRAPKR